MITVSHLTRRFGPVVAVDDLSFRVEQGEVVGFLGLNGAGKTTTLRVLTGFLPATSGSVSIAGFDVLRQSLEVRRRIGYLPESVPLYREHRVEEMLQFQGRLRGLSRAETRRRTGAVLESVGMLDRRRSVIGRLSKGQRQRIGIAVALLAEPEVLILDEPTSGLDPLQRLELRQLVSALARERTVLVSSHILPEIEAVCPRVIILHRGRLAADGTPEALVATLGAGACVRVEAAVGAAAAEAQRLLAGLPGVSGVEDRGTSGIHRVFEVRGEGDLREDVGALAAQRGWALRELSWHEPTLEQLFARIALGGAEASREEPAAAPAPSAPAASRVQLELPVARPPQAAPQKPGRQAYNLNPFERGPRPATGDCPEGEERKP